MGEIMQSWHDKIAALPAFLLWLQYTNSRYNWRLERVNSWAASVNSASRLTKKENWYACRICRKRSRRVKNSWVIIKFFNSPVSQVKTKAFQLLYFWANQILWDGPFKLVSLPILRFLCSWCWLIFYYLACAYWLSSHREIFSGSATERLKALRSFEIKI
jgi:hypothetical protein